MHSFVHRLGATTGQAIFLWLFVVAILVSSIRAQPLHSGSAEKPSDSLRTVDLQEALRLFREHNLSLRRARSEAKARQGEARQAAAYPNPTLQATHEPLWREGTTESETYLTVNQTL